MIDYETLRLVWWLLLGVLLIGLAITDGFDLGVGALLTLVGKTDQQRRVMINTIGPHWDGNQVWLITAGGAIFAAWPLIYATAFSGFYIALFITLMALWMRPLGFDYRGKVDDPRWRQAWDWALFAGGIVPALIYGVAFGNLFLGVPFVFDDTLKSTYEGNFFGLLHPFALLSGVLSVSMILAHGAAWLQMKTDGVLRARAAKITVVLSVLTAVLFALAGLWITQLDGYSIISTISTSASSNPLGKEVGVSAGAWLDNYSRYPITIVAPVLALLAAPAAAILSARMHAGMAFVATALMQTGIITTAGFSLFPFLLPSNTHPTMSLTIWDATSSHLTLNIMFWVAMVFIPVVLAYTSWSFYKMAGRLKESDLDKSNAIY